MTAKAGRVARYDADHPAAVRDAYSFFRPAAPYRIVGKHP